MASRDDELDFDFFDDDTRESEPFEEERPPRRLPGGRPPRRPSARGPVGLTPLLRLAGLVAFAILVVVLLVFWIASCEGASKKSAYTHYLDKVATVAHDSESIGRELNSALTTQGIKIAALETKISGLAQREQQDVVAAQQMSPPGPLRLQHQDAIEALQFRVSGLRGLADAFAHAARTPKKTSANSLLLTGQAERLVAGDVVWADLFKAPTVEELRAQGVTGVTVPGSVLVPGVDYASTHFWQTVLQRLQGTPSGGTTTGLHGTGLISVKAEPGDQQLSPTTTNTVRATTNLGFAVTVQDTGDYQEVQVKVTLTIQQAPSPIVQTKAIDLINPGQQKTVLFNNLPQVQFATKTTVKVDVQAVPGEKNLSNNSGQYPVIFSLG